jgi:hypothetical protein
MARTQHLSPDQAGDVTVSSRQTALAIDHLEKRLPRNRTVAWPVVAGLPALASRCAGFACRRRRRPAPLRGSSAGPCGCWSAPAWW